MPEPLALNLGFDHLGVVVPEVAPARPRLATIFGITRWTRLFEDPLHQVFVQFGRDPSGIVYELISPRGQGSPVCHALDKGQNLLNHVAYRAPSLGEAAALLRRRGCMPLGQAAPAVAFGGASVQFFLTPLRFILEIIEGTLPVHEYNVQDGL